MAVIRRWCDLTLDGDTLYWIEMRPTEDGPRWSSDAARTAASRMSPLLHTAPALAEAVILALVAPCQGNAGYFVGRMEAGD